MPDCTSCRGSARRPEAGRGVRAATRWLPVLVAALASVLLPAVPKAATGAAAPPAALSGVVSVAEVVFCADSPGPFDESGCRWEAVRLPHRWEPRGREPAWGLYRAQLQHPGLPVIGVLADRLSLHGSVRVGTQVVHPPQAAGDDLAHLRYWPQMYTVSLPDPAAQPSLRIDIAVRGHPQAKSGLGSLAIAPVALAQTLHDDEVRQEVLVMLALAAATAMAGLAGLAAGDRRTLAGRLLRTVGWIALLASARIAMNFVTHLPLPMAAWTGLNLVLLAAIAASVCVVMAQYLFAHRTQAWPAAAAWTALMALGLTVLPESWTFRWAEACFIAVAAVGCALFTRLAWRMARAPEAAGLIILLPILSIIVLGLHDLLMHLGQASMSDRYLQKWSVPGLLILMIVLLGRRVVAQRTVEAALSRETARREELLRDLHDGIGSRLVALSFHAQRGGDASQLGAEIDALLRELQLIQGAVRAGPTTLQALLADLRHLYARIGGGNLPLHWPELDFGQPVHLTAPQAVATVRIFEEAVANALKHARPQAITVSVESGAPTHAAALSICDDGSGRFEPERGRGLHNMRVRAEQAGLVLHLQQPGPGHGRKAVRLLFPAPQSWHRTRLSVLRRFFP